MCLYKNSAPGNNLQSFTGTTSYSFWLLLTNMRCNILMCWWTISHVFSQKSSIQLSKSAFCHRTRSSAPPASFQSLIYLESPSALIHILPYNRQPAWTNRPVLKTRLGGWKACPHSLCMYEAPRVVQLLAMWFYTAAALCNTKRLTGLLNGEQNMLAFSEQMSKMTDIPTLT